MNRLVWVTNRARGVKTGVVAYKWSPGYEIVRLFSFAGICLGAAKHTHIDDWQGTHGVVFFVLVLVTSQELRVMLCMVSVL